MRAFLRRIRRTITQWWECRRQRCDYYGHYLAYGPPDMPHTTWHLVERQGSDHFRTCHWDYDRNGRLCPTCLSYEKRLRA